jgi:hypothetical protein
MPAIIMRPSALAAIFLLSTTTSAVAAGSCDVTFRLASASTQLLSVGLSVDYSGANGEFEGLDVDVNCTPLINASAGYVDNEVARILTLNMGQATAGPITAPNDYARCVFLPNSGTPTVGDFEFFIATGLGTNFMPATVSFVISDISCEGTSNTTTTTTVSTTTTTLFPPMPACGDPDGNGITATDALFMLGAALGLQICDNCFCDVDDSDAITSSDALRVLNRAVGLPVDLICPICF